MINDLGFGPVTEFNGKDICWIINGNPLEEFTMTRIEFPEPVTVLSGETLSIHFEVELDDILRHGNRRIPWTHLFDTMGRRRWSHTPSQPLEGADQGNNGPD